ncbi:DivIVA domain-containing protein [Lapidilactobacillus salsurivasis]
MALKPDDIRNKSFESKFRGWDPEQVKPFLTQLATELGELQEKNQQLTQSLKESQERVAYFTDLKDALNQSIIVAQNAADRVKNNAQHEADMIKTDAEKQSKQMLTEATERSNQILQDASERARHLTIETDELKKDTRVFHQRLQVLLESQLAMIKTPEWRTLLGKGEESANRVGALLDEPFDDRDPDHDHPSGGAGSAAATAPAQAPEASTTPAPKNDEAPAAPVRPENPAAEFSAALNQGSVVPEVPPVPADRVTDDAAVFHYRSHTNGDGPADTAPDEENMAAPDQNYDGVTIVFPEENE